MMEHNDPYREQRLAALAKANRIRSDRRAIRDKMESHELPPYDVLLNPPQVCLDVAVYTFLKWVPGVRHKRAMMILQGILFSQTVTLGQLSPATREKIANRIRHYQPSRPERHHTNVPPRRTTVSA